MNTFLQTEHLTIFKTSNQQMLIENEFIRHFTAGFERSPAQINQLHESDAELLKFNSELLAITVDGLAEEIDSGLYDDPYQIGWMAVTASMSDLAAVGAKPLGILLNLQTPRMPSRNGLSELSQGIQDACSHYGTYILGGDTNFSSSLRIASIALGVVEKTKPLKRRGGQIGDLVYSTGAFGSGSAFGLEKLIYQNSNFPYHPTARLRESLFIRDYASACIDTSDGLFPALAQLSEINGFGFSISKDVSDLLAPSVQQLAGNRGVPPWMFLAGPHGEFELIFIVAFDKRKSFLRASLTEHFEPLLIGEVVSGTQTTFLTGGHAVCTDLNEITNLFYKSGEDPSAYLNNLKNLHTKWKLPY